MSEPVNPKPKSEDAKKDGTEDVQTPFIHPVDVGLWSEEAHIRWHFEDTQEQLGINSAEMSDIWSIEEGEYTEFINGGEIPERIRRLRTFSAKAGSIDFMLRLERTVEDIRRRFACDAFFAKGRDDLRCSDWGPSAEERKAMLARLKSCKGCSTPEETSNTSGKSLHTCRAAFNGDAGSLEEVGSGLFDTIGLSLNWYRKGHGRKFVRRRR